MQAAGFVLFATLAVLMPALVVAWNEGAMAPFWFLAGDAYLYLGIGEHSQGWVMSYDGTRPTNGFHPLWQLVVRLGSAISGGGLAAMALAAWGAILCTLGGTLALGAAIRRFTGSWALALLAVPGVYFLVIGQALGNLPVWAFFDGMEAGLAFLLAGLFFWLLAAPRPSMAALGLVLGLLVLTRLDEIFVPAGIYFAVLAWPGKPLAQRLRDAALLVLPTALMVLAYLGWSWATTGMLAPVSGAAKGEGALLQNVWVTLATFFAPIIDLREGLTAYTADRDGLLGGAFRVVELVVPALFAAIFLTIVLRRFRARPWAAVMAGLSGGVLMKAAYNLIAVNYWHQAPWYFAVALALMTLGTAILLAPALQRATAQHAAAPAFLALGLGTMTLLHASLWTQGLMTNPLPARDRDFWLARAGTEAAIRAAEPDPRVLEFGDGLLNFTFGFPVRHGFVFAGDARSLAALREGRLLTDAGADGYHLISSYDYLRVPEGAEAWDSATIRAFLDRSFLDPRIKSELDRFDFAMVHVARPWGVPVIRLIPRR